jgi:hypothetical protein
LREAETLLPDHDTLPSATPPSERLSRMQELLEQRNHWAAQPNTPEREQALKSISSSLRKLGQETIGPPESV